MRKKKHVTRVLAVLTSASLLAAGSMTAFAAETTYPVTVTTYGRDGSELETVYEKAPEKVLAVYQGCIETLLALGLEDHIVAAAGLDNAVPDDQTEAFEKLNYLDEFTPSLETVTMLDPDMIFSWGSYFGEDTLGEASDWIDKGVNTYISSNTKSDGSDRTLENEYTDILNMGIIFNVQDKAEEIVNEMKDTIASVLEQTASIEEKPTVMVIEFGSTSITNYGASSLGGDMVQELGGVLVNDVYGSIGQEDVIAGNPDVIFIVYMPYSGDDPEEVKNDRVSRLVDEEVYQSLNAVQNGRVYPIMLSEMYASATRTQDGIRTFAQGLYPDLTLE